MTSVTVVCNRSEAFWESPPDNITLTDTTDVWRVPVISASGLLNELESLLLSDELEKSFRFRQLKDKCRFITRKAALRIILSKYLHIPATEIQFLIGKNKKPAIKGVNGIDLHYNVSHSGDWILIAVSSSETGIDVEQTNTGFDYTDVLNESFSKSETEYVQSQTDPGTSFFELWTRKETLTKATSKGLDDDFSAIPCLDGEHQVESDLLRSEKNWTISSFTIDSRHIGSVAFPPSKSLRFFDFIMNQYKL